MVRAWSTAATASKPPVAETQPSSRRSVSRWPLPRSARLIALLTGEVVPRRRKHVTARRQQDTRTDRRARAVLVTLTGLIWIAPRWSPWPNAVDVVPGGARSLWLLPPWAMWLEHHRGLGAWASRT